LVDERQLLPADFHLVSMQQRRRFGAEADAVDQHFRFWNRLGDYDLTVWKALQFRVARQDSGNGERDGAAWICAEDNFPLRKREPPPSHFKQRHARALPYL
jgi:hypothetical protein